MLFLTFFFQKKKIIKSIRQERNHITHSRGINLRQNLKYHAIKSTVRIMLVNNVVSHSAPKTGQKQCNVYCENFLIPKVKNSVGLIEKLEDNYCHFWILKCSQWSLLDKASKYLDGCIIKNRLQDWVPQILEHYFPHCTEVWKRTVRIFAITTFLQNWNIIGIPTLLNNKEHLNPDDIIYIREDTNYIIVLCREIPKSIGM